MLIPLYRRQLSMIGPHAECTMTAESFQRHTESVYTRRLIHARKRQCLVYCHIVFVVHFGVAVLMMTAFVAGLAVLLVLFSAVMLFIRAQYKVNCVLNLLDMQILELDTFNDYMTDAIDILKTLVGGFGLVSFFFVMT